MAKRERIDKSVKVFKVDILKFITNIYYIRNTKYRNNQENHISLYKDMIVNLNSITLGCDGSY
jgi:hypothetical protein